LENLEGGPLPNQDSVFGFESESIGRMLSAAAAARAGQGLGMLTRARDASNEELSASSGLSRGWLVTRFELPASELERNEYRSRRQRFHPLAQSWPLGIDFEHELRRINWIALECRGGHAQPTTSVATNLAVGSAFSLGDVDREHGANPIASFTARAPF